jgi:hypothetical protein
MSTSTLHNNDNRFLLESRIQQLDLLKQAVSHYQLLDLQNIIFELHIALIQYVNRFDIQMRPTNHSRIHYVTNYPPIEVIPYMVLDLLRLLVQDIENNEFEDITNIIPIHVSRLRQRLYNENNTNEIPTIKERDIQFPEKKIINLKKRDLDIPLENPCGICLESHIKKETIECCCSHSFGKECFKNWITTCKNKNKKITCPNCRNKIKSITHFSESVPQCPMTNDSAYGSIIYSKNGAVSSIVLPNTNSTWRDVI